MQVRAGLLYLRFYSIGFPSSLSLSFKSPVSAWTLYAMSFPVSNQHPGSSRPLLRRSWFIKKMFTLTALLLFSRDGFLVLPLQWSFSTIWSASLVSYHSKQASPPITFIKCLPTFKMYPLYEVSSVAAKPFFSRNAIIPRSHALYEIRMSWSWISPRNGGISWI